MSVLEALDDHVFRNCLPCSRGQIVLEIITSCSLEEGVPCIPLYFGSGCWRGVGLCHTVQQGSHQSSSCLLPNHFGHIMAADKEVTTLPWIKNPNFHVEDKIANT